MNNKNLDVLWHIFFYFFFIENSPKEGRNTRAKKGGSQNESGAMYQNEIKDFIMYLMHFWAQKQVYMYIPIFTKFFLYQNSLGFLTWINDKYAHLFQKI